MTINNLGTAQTVQSMLRSNSVLVEVGGSVRRITLDNLMNSINAGNEQLLRQVAWGVPLQPNGKTSTDWGNVGNIGMYEEFDRASGRYLVTNDGRAAKLLHSTSAYYADGTQVDESKGHIMTIRPRLYFLVKKDAVSGNSVLWMSQLPIGGHYIEMDVSGAYMGSIAGTALTSRSGLAPAGNKSINAFWAAAQVNGKNWGLCSYQTFQSKLVMIALSEYGDSNIQKVLGHGVCGSISKDLWSEASKLKTGATKSLGDSFGKIPITLKTEKDTGVDCSRINLAGTEDPYGWMWTMLQGAYFGCSDNSAQDGTEIFVYEGNRIPSSAELGTHPTGKYRQLKRLGTSGFISELILGEYFDLFPSKLDGQSTSGWSDYTYNDGKGQLCLWGGSANPGPVCGLVCSNSDYAFSSALSVFGARLAYYGPITFVDGKDII